MQRDWFEQYRQVGASIAYYREKRGITRQELAARIGSTTDHIKQIEAYGSARASPLKSPWTGKSMDLLLAIADSLEVEAMIFFLPGSDENFAKYRTDR